MKIKYEGKIQEVELKRNVTVSIIAKKLNIPIETVIARRDGKVITDITEVTNDDEIEFIKVISGG